LGVSKYGYGIMITLAKTNVRQKVPYPLQSCWYLCAKIRLDSNLWHRK